MTLGFGDGLRRHNKLNLIRRSFAHVNMSPCGMGCITPQRESFDFGACHHRVPG